MATDFEKTGTVDLGTFAVNTKLRGRVDSKSAIGSFEFVGKYGELEIPVLKGDKGETGAPMDFLQWVENLSEIPPASENAMKVIFVNENKNIYYSDGVDWISALLFEKGDKGDKGEVGEKGEKGDKGNRGAALKILGSVDVAESLPENAENGDVYLVIDGNRMFVRIDGEWIDFTPESFEINIPSGPKGDRGVEGKKGDKGDKGDPGIKGDKGDKGNKGDRGEKGDTGASGPAGKSVPVGCIAKSVDIKEQVGVIPISTSSIASQLPSGTGIISNQLVIQSYGYWLITLTVLPRDSSDDVKFAGISAIMSSGTKREVFVPKQSYGSGASAVMMLYAGGGAKVEFKTSNTRVNAAISIQKVG